MRIWNYLLIHLAASAAGGALDSAGLGDAPWRGVPQTCRIEGPFGRDKDHENFLILAGSLRSGERVDKEG